MNENLILALLLFFFFLYTLTLCICTEFNGKIKWVLPIYSFVLFVLALIGV